MWLKLFLQNQVHNFLIGFVSKVGVQIIWQKDKEMSSIIGEASQSVASDAFPMRQRGFAGRT